jgi:hypothetical protein
LLSIPEACDHGDAMIEHNDSLLPVDIVLAPEWWHAHEGITFDRDFFFHPARRVEDEQKMEQALYERWGAFGLGEHRKEPRAEVGAVHLAAGYLLSEMLGCRVEYTESHPPQVIAAGQDDLGIDVDAAFESDAFRALTGLVDELKKHRAPLCGDVNFGGILNLAMDLRGEAILMDMYDKPDEVRAFFGAIHEVITRFVDYIQDQTGTSSVSVNRTVRHRHETLFLHSECSYTMISDGDYEKFLLPFDCAWSERYRPFGIHYCGSDAHRKAASFAKLPHLDFLDVGWGGDVAELRHHLPDTFLNIRLDPVSLRTMPLETVREEIRGRIEASANPVLTGVCCINMDHSMPDETVSCIFETVEACRISKMDRRASRL